MQGLPEMRVILNGVNWLDWKDDLARVLNAEGLTHVVFREEGGDLPSAEQTSRTARIMVTGLEGQWTRSVDVSTNPADAYKELREKSRRFLSLAFDGPAPRSSLIFLSPFFRLGRAAASSVPDPGPSHPILRLTDFFDPIESPNRDLSMTDARTNVYSETSSFRDDGDGPVQNSQVVEPDE